MPLRVTFGLERDETTKCLAKLQEKKVFRIYYIQPIILVSAKLVEERLKEKEIRARKRRLRVPT
jgi:hypothetical protein